MPATKVDKTINFQDSTAVVLSDTGIVGLMLFDTSNGWRNATLAWEIAAPYWLLTFAFAALPVWWCYQHFGSRRAQNLCRRCGYDQRGTRMAGHNVCPECGTVCGA